jgi:hypothetical protein
VFRLVKGYEGVHVSGCSREARGASGGGGNWIVDLACGSECRQGKGSQSRCPLLPARKGSDALDCFARTGVRGNFRLVQRQHPLSAIGSPESDKAKVFYAQFHASTSVVEQEQPGSRVRSSA